MLLFSLSLLPTRDACSASTPAMASAKASRSDISWILDRAASSFGPDAVRGLSASASAFMTGERATNRETEKTKRVQNELDSSLSFRFVLVHSSLSVSLALSRTSLSIKEKMERKGAVQATIVLEGAEIHRVEVTGNSALSLVQEKRRET